MKSQDEMIKRLKFLFLGKKDSIKLDKHTYFIFVISLITVFLQGFVILNDILDPLALYALFLNILIPIILYIVFYFITPFSKDFLLGLLTFLSVYFLITAFFGLLKLILVDSFGILISFILDLLIFAFIIKSAVYIFSSMYKKTKKEIFSKFFLSFILILNFSLLVIILISLGPIISN